MKGEHSLSRSVLIGDGLYLPRSIDRLKEGAAIGQRLPAEALPVDEEFRFISRRIHFDDHGTAFKPAVIPGAFGVA